MQFVVRIHMDENVYTYGIYMLSIICCMQLKVGYNLFYATLPNVVACGMCNWNLIANTNCKIENFF